MGVAVASKEEAKKRSKIEQLSPDQLLQSNKKNFDVPFSRISRLELGRKLGTSRLHVVTQDETYKFKFEGVKLEQLENSIRPPIPANVSLQAVDKRSD